MICFYEVCVVLIASGCVGCTHGTRGGVIGFWGVCRDWCCWGGVGWGDGGVEGMRCRDGVKGVLGVVGYYIKDKLGCGLLGGVDCRGGGGEGFGNEFIGLVCCRCGLFVVG